MGHRLVHAREVLEQCWDDSLADPQGFNVNAENFGASQMQAKTVDSSPALPAPSVSTEPNVKDPVVLCVCVNAKIHPMFTPSPGSPHARLPGDPPPCRWTPKSSNGAPAPRFPWVFGRCPCAKRPEGLKHPSVRYLNMMGAA